MLTTWMTMPVLDRVMADFARAEVDAPLTIPADVRENDREYTFELDVPGVKVDDLEITLNNRVLSVHGVRQFARGENEKVTYGRARGELAASWTLPDTIDGDQLTADLSDGVLTIRVPKHPKAQPRRIAIGRGDGSSDRQLTGG